MTLFDAEPEVIPGLPGVSVLAEMLAGFLAASRADGQQHGTPLGEGLRLRVGTAEGEFVALSRLQGRPSETEIDIVGQATGWPAWATTWTPVKKVWYAVLTPEDPAPADPAMTAAKPKDTSGKEPPEDPEFPDGVIRAALLDRAAPWRAIQSDFMHDQRDAAIKDKRRAELLEDIAWLRRKFPSQLRAWQRARIAAALA